ncbi:MAG TPA: Na+/H+ antiporter [Polyangiales bacterium]|nr:Na+/H+ antiporter [Polyangiales bacterium]
MHRDLLVVLVLLLVVVMLQSVSARMRLSFPILLVLVGLAISLIPGLPRVTLAPDVVFLVFLPPLLYEAAWFTSWREFKRLRNAISLQAVGLVFCTAAVVAWVAHEVIPGFSWALGFLLGGIIAPPDAVAATSVLQGLRIPRTSVAILEGESLVNDATSLIVVRFALAAVGTGLFVVEQAAAQLAWVSVAGVGLGLLIAHGVYLLHRQLRSSAPVDTALTLLTPYLEYVLAEQVHASGVLAVVAGGLYLSARQHHFLDARTRVFAIGTWATAMFVLNGAVFILIGLQLPIVVEDLRTSSLLDAVSFGLLISLAAIAVRLAWTFAAAFLPSLLPARQRPDWKLVTLVGWAGMRGVVSLAAALAIPAALPDGQAFPQRSLLVFVTFVVILVTLVAQGLSLPPLVRALRFDLPNDEHKHRQALDDHLAAHAPALGMEDSALREHVSSQRTELLRLKGAGKVSHELSREKELELDLELARLDGRLEARTRH